MQPRSGRRYHELRAGNEVFATLSWTGSWVTRYGSLATAMWAEGTYSLRKGGTLQQFVTIGRVDRPGEFGKLKLKLGGGGVLEFEDYRQYTLKRLSFWKSKWGFTDWNDALLCTIMRKAKVLRYSGDVGIETPGKPPPIVTLLIVVGWYVMVQEADQSEGYLMVHSG